MNLRKTLIPILMLLFGIFLCSCGSNNSGEIPDLDGSWKETGSDSNYQEAIISGDEIQIYWIDTSDNSRSIYWSGSFTAPSTSETPYSWKSTSNLNESGLDTLLASTDDSKEFTYDDGKITYEVSALGETRDVTLEKIDSNDAQVKEVDKKFIKGESSDSSDSTTSTDTQDDSSKTETTTESKDTSQSSGQVYSIGQTGTALDVQVTLKSATIQNQLMSDGIPLDPPEGKEFLVLDFDVVNNSDEEIMVTSSSFDTYVDNQTTDASTSGMMADNALASDLDLAPGRQTSGTVAYEVSPDWSTLETELKPNPLMDDAVKFKVTSSEVS